jgi:hypothetical protein
MGLGDVVNKFLNDDSFSDSGTTEKSNFTSSGVGGEHVNDLDSCDQNLGAGCLLVEGWGLSVDGISLLSGDGTSLVNGISNDVHDATQSFWAHWDTDWCTCIVNSLSSD